MGYVVLICSGEFGFKPMLETAHLVVGADLQNGTSGGAVDGSGVLTYVSGGGGAGSKSGWVPYVVKTTKIVGN